MSGPDTIVRDFSRKVLQGWSKLKTSRSFRDCKRNRTDRGDWRMKENCTQKTRPQYIHGPKFTASISRFEKLLSEIFLSLDFLIFYLYSGVCITGSSMRQIIIINTPVQVWKKSKLETALKEISSKTSGWTCRQAGECLACLCQRCVSSWFYQNTHTHTQKKKCINVIPLRVTSLHKKGVFWDPLSPQSWVFSLQAPFSAAVSC